MTGEEAATTLRRMTSARLTLIAAALLLPACPLDGGEDTDGDETGGPTGSGTQTGGMTAPTGMTGMTSMTSPSTMTDPTTETETGGNGNEVTIYDIRMGNVPPDTVVTIRDVVVTSQVQQNDGAVFVQEQDGGEYSAIYLYVEDIAATLDLSPGDVVDVTGFYSEFFDQSQISANIPGDIVVTGSTDVPTPVTVNAADIAAGGASAEAYESVLVRVEDVEATGATNEFGDIPIDDGLIISNFFLWDTGDGLDVLPGTTFGFVQGPLLYAFEEFKVAPRDENDYDAMLVPCEDVATTATIFEVQMGNFEENDYVRIEDVIVTTPIGARAGDLFNVQDAAGGAFSGISVFVVEPDGLDVEPGDQVSICGVYTEFFEESQLRVQAVDDITSSGTAPVPAAEVLASSTVGAGAEAEDWEGVLVTVEDVTVSVAPNCFGEWEVDDVLLTSDAFFENGWPMPAVDDTYTTLTGVMQYSFDRYKLAPRDTDDIAP